ncbi:MAG TPA: hypothetical protein DCE47_12905 [Planctomycetaceae bacterium]|nr:hypothetical protein [Planctomycetaceae bacterium]|tara:strand:- start:2447 stop:3181 length:735 start_codon:yes stop_codon:yes gene_type:complete
MGGIDILLLIILGLVTWSVASEGIWGAALTSLIVIFSGLLAMNFFEPVAGMLEGLGSSLWWRSHCDILALLGLFAGLVLGLRTLTDRISPRFITSDRLAYGLGRWGGGLLAGYVTMAFLLTALHTGPFPRNFWGFTPERRNLLNIVAPDRQWLGFTQWVSEETLKRSGGGKIFDGPRTIRPSTGEGIGPHGNTTWPSFIIRYATRRQQIASGTLAIGGGATSSGGGVRIEQGAPSQGGGGGPTF